MRLEVFFSRLLPCFEGWKAVRLPTSTPNGAAVVVVLVCSNLKLCPSSESHQPFNINVFVRVLMPSPVPLTPTGKRKADARW